MGRCRGAARPGLGVPVIEEIELPQIEVSPPVDPLCRVHTQSHAAPEAARRGVGDTVFEIALQFRRIRFALHPMPREAVEFLFERPKGTSPFRAPEDRLMLLDT